jgi:signal peptidase II
MLYLFALASILIDQASKFLITSGFWLNGRIDIFSDFLYLQSTKNSWVAFSFPIEWILLKVLTVVLITWIIIFYYRYEWQKEVTAVKIGYGLVIGGAISNAIERIFVGHVVDFIWVKYFAIFNLADVSITIWAILLLLIYSGLWNKQK